MIVILDMAARIITAITNSWNGKGNHMQWQEKAEENDIDNHGSKFVNTHQPDRACTFPLQVESTPPQSLKEGTHPKILNPTSLKSARIFHYSSQTLYSPKSRIP